MKKLLALLLAGAMALSLNVTAFAESTATTDKRTGQIVNSDGDLAYASNSDTLTPGTDYYYVIGLASEYDMLTDSDYVRFKLKKDTNGKYISDPDLTTKSFGGTRYVCVVFSVKDFYTDAEYKVEMTSEFTARKDIYVQNPTQVKLGQAFPIFDKNAITTKSATTTEAAAKEALAAAQTAETNAKKALDDAKAELAKLEAALKAKAEAVNALKSGAITTPYSDKATDEANAKTTYESSLGQLDTQGKQDQLAAQAKDLNDKITALEAQIKDLQAKIDALKNPTTTPVDTSKLEAAIIEAKAAIVEIKATLVKIGADPDATVPTALLATDSRYNPASLLAVFNAVTDEETTWTSANTLIQGLRGVEPSTSIFKDVPPIAKNTEGEGNNKAAVGTAINAVITGQLTAIKAQNTNIADLQKQIDDAKKPAPLNTAEISNLESQKSSLQSQKSTLEAQLNVIANTPATLATPVTSAEVTAAKNLWDAYAAYNTAFKAWKAQNDKIGTTATGLLKAYNDAVAAREAAEKVLKSVQAGGVNVNTDAVDPVTGLLKSGKTITTKFKIWIANDRQNDNDDASFVAGEKGVVIKPVKNEENTITWENNDGAIAILKFYADSDTSYICPRLSTKWNNADYADYFDNQDAYLYDFVTNPKIPAETRGELQLINRFINSNDDYYHDVEDLYVYQIVDGDLVDVTRRFTAKENDDGDQVLSTKTMTLGTYIVCEEQLDLDDEIISGGNSGTTKPVETLPPVNITDNKKPVPNTGC